MKTLLKTAKLAALTFVIGTTLLPATVLALPYYERDVFYYDSADYTTIVGHFNQNCTGRTAQDGVRTPWYTETLTECDFNQLPPLG